MPTDDPKLIGEEGENAFAALCDRLECEYLRIEQTIDSYSGEMFRNDEKRPDFLIKVKDIPPFLVEIKVKERVSAGREGGKLDGVPAFGEMLGRFNRTKNLENKIGMNVWYGFVERLSNGQIVRKNAYLVPMSRIEKHIPANVKANPKRYGGWWINVPIECMNDWGRDVDLGNKCQSCESMYCAVDKK